MATENNSNWLLEEFARQILEETSRKAGAQLLDDLKNGLRDAIGHEVKKELSPLINTLEKKIADSPAFVELQDSFKAYDQKSTNAVGLMFNKFNETLITEINKLSVAQKIVKDRVDAIFDNTTALTEKFDLNGMPGKRYSSNTGVIPLESPPDQPKEIPDGGRIHRDWLANIRRTIKDRCKICIGLGVIVATGVALAWWNYSEKKGNASNSSAKTEVPQTLKVEAQPTPPANTPQPDLIASKVSVDAATRLLAIEVKANPICKPSTKGKSTLRDCLSLPSAPASQTSLDDLSKSIAAIRDDEHHKQVVTLLLNAAVKAGNRKSEGQVDTNAEPRMVTDLVRWRCIEPDARTMPSDRQELGKLLACVLSSFPSGTKQ